MWKSHVDFILEKLNFFPKMWEFFQFSRISILLKWSEIKPFFQFFGKKEHFCVKVMSILCRKNNIFLKKFRNFAFFKNFQSREMVWNTVFFFDFPKKQHFFEKVMSILYCENEHFPWFFRISDVVKWSETQSFFGFFAKKQHFFQKIMSMLYCKNETIISRILQQKIVPE